jgi:glycosyltransferase involved in cell wall biosynthesis
MIGRRRVTVTVLMPMYNAACHLAEAIESVLAQTFVDFELLIVNDGSTDDSRAIAASYDDPRIRIVDHERNLGFAPALNHGLEVATGDLVARQDADDRALPARLAEQVALMHSRSDLALLGSQAFRIDEHGRRVGVVNRCLQHETAVWSHLFENPFIHTSVMFRRAIVRDLGGYEAAFDPILEDHALWSRVLQRFRTLNVAARLVEYRVVPTSMTGDLLDVTARDSHPRRAAFARVLRRLLDRNLRAMFPGEVSEADAETASRFLLGVDRGTVDDFLGLYFRLLARFRATHPEAVRSVDFRRAVGRQLDALAYRTAPYTRATTICVVATILRRDPASAGVLPWGRMAASVTMGRSARRRLGRFEVSRADGR